MALAHRLGAARRHARVQAVKTRPAVQVVDTSDQTSTAIEPYDVIALIRASRCSFGKFPRMSFCNSFGRSRKYSSRSASSELSASARTLREMSPNS